MKKMFTFLVATTLFTSAFAQYGHNGQYPQSYPQQPQVNQPTYGGGYGHNNQQPNGGYQNNQNYGGGCQTEQAGFFSDERAMTMKRNEMIARINYDFNDREASVNRNWFKSRERKYWEIQALETQRAQAIANVYARFTIRNGGFDHHDRDRNDHDGFRHW